MNKGISTTLKRNQVTSDALTFTQSIMNLLDLDISSATLPKQALLPSEGGIRGQVYLPVGFNELKLFALLKAKFGPPNGFLTHLGRPGGDPDGPFKWDYIFTPNGTLNVQVVRGVMALELQWWNDDVVPSDLVDYLERSMKLHNDKIKYSIQQLDHYKLILNPYVRHKVLVDLAEKELDELVLVEPCMPNPESIDTQELEAYGVAYSEYMVHVDKQASLTLLAVTEAAYMAEASLNLILAVLVKPDLRASKTMFKETVMRRWRSKLERLPLDCHHIQSPDMGDTRLRDAKIMFDLRNKVAHSYPDKDEMKVGEMWFEQSFPILSEGQPFKDFALALHNQLPSVKDAKFCIASSKKFTAYLLELVEPEMRKNIEFFLESNPIGFNETKGVYGVPFGRTVITYSGPGPRIENSQPDE